MDKFNMDDYIALSVDNRNLFDDWLKECGATPERVREVRIDGDNVITVEWVIDRLGKLAYNYKLKDVETAEFTYNKLGEPPCWHPQR